MTKSVSDILEQDDRYSQYLVDKMIATVVGSTLRNTKLAYQICSGFEQNFAEAMRLADMKFPRKKVKKATKKFIMALRLAGLLMLVIGRL